MNKSLLICFLVGCAVAVSANQSGAWKQKTEYVYRVHGRTLAALHDVADQYTGMLIRANLKIQTKSDNRLIAQIVNPEQANIHVSLPEGWSSYIPEEQLHYKPLALSNKPFEILLENGAVKELLVNRDISEWEANLIKSFVSQIQVDIRAENLEPSRVNQKLESSEYSANYKVMEPTVTGECVTMYNIMPAGEHILAKNPELVPLAHLKGDGKVIRVFKSKDYSQCKEMAEEHFALDIVNEKIYGKASEYLIKSGDSEIFITGNKDHHTIQSSHTVNKVIVSPTMANAQKGMVVSSMNLTLISVNSAEQEITVESPVSIGNLVYSEDKPSEMTTRQSTDSYDSQRRPLVRTRRSINDIRRDSSEEEEQSFERSMKPARRPMPKLDAAPDMPLLRSIARELKTELKPLRAASKYVKELALAIQNPAKFTKDDALSQFSSLISIIRMMNAAEVKEFSQQVWEKYQQDRDNSIAVLEWKVTRDAIAQSGTGPALLVIKHWLQNKMIETEEAAQVLAVLPRSAQQPTEEYIRTFFELSKCQYVKPQIMVNETAILSLTELVRLAYVDHHYAAKRFSMQEDSEKKIDFVKKELVPFLAEKLEQAIESDDSDKAQVYIRALGNVADKSVFAVFKPYLEGERKISKFQRLLMIVSMDQLAKVHPKTTRAILYRIILNNGESSQVRVASIYQIMQCAPSKATLQSLASLTFTEPSKHVRAAIKSSIEATSELKGIEFAYVAENAKAAVKLLNPETYGVQYAYNYLKDFIVKEMPLKYTQSMHSIFGEDSVWPNHLHYSFRLIEGDVSRQFMDVSAMLSSIKTLTSVLSQQFPETEKRSTEHAWADKIANLLNIQMDQPEKLEANILFEIFGGKRFLTLNNQTLEQLPELYKSLIRELESGHRFNYTKLYVDDEVHFVFPTEMSLPFFYTLRRPSLINVGGQVQIPGKLNTKNVKINGEIKIVSAHVTEAKLGFVSPFDRKYYVAGYTKNMMLNLPLSVKLNMDLEKQRVNFELAPVQPDQDENILHISTWPYTHQESMMAETTGPLSKRVHLIHKEQDQKFETVMGKDNGIVFKAQFSNEKHNYVDFHTMQESIKTYGPWAAPLIALIRERTIRHSMLNINYIARESTSRSVNFALSYKQMRGQLAQNGNEEQINMESLYAIPAVEKETREREYLKKVSSGLKNPSAAVVDMTVQFSGKSEPKYAATFALATNDVENKYQQLVYLFKSASQEAKPFQLFGSVSTKTTVAPHLNFIEALRAESNLKSDVKIRFGHEQQNLSELKLKVKFDKSEERRQALQRSDMANLCKRQMENKKSQHPVCANLTIQASTMDRMFIEAQHQNIDRQTKNMFNKLMNLARFLGYDYLEEKFETVQNVNENTIRVYAQMEPEFFNAVNVTIQTPVSETSFKNIRLNKWVRPLLSANTEVNPIDLFMAKATRRVQANSVCVIENNAANTFNNKSYPLALGNCYHVLLHINLDQQTYQDQHYGYTVLVRDSVKYANTKDLKIVYYYRYISQILDLVSIGENKYEVYVNDKKIELPQSEAYIVNDDVNKPWAKIVYQQNELRVDFDLTQVEQLEDVTIYYNGARVKVAIDDKFQGQVRGLCGTVSGESFFDFVTPRNTIIPDARLFSASYALVDETCQGPAKDKQRLAATTRGIRRETIFTRVVSENDISESHESNERCNARHQTRYTIENEGKTICFTTRPLPVCGSGCRAGKTIEKTVNVHCLQRSNSVNLYKSQIDKGASPDFSGKQVTKTIKIKVPQTCH